MKNRKNQKGFSLVELLIVVAIIGIIAAIAIPSLLAARRAANEAGAQENLRTISSSEATYYSRNGVYTDFAGLTGAKMLDGEWTDGVVRGNYTFAEAGLTDQTFFFTAVPVAVATGTDEKGFGVGEDFVIRFELNGGTATTASSAIGVTP